MDGVMGGMGYPMMFRRVLAAALCAAVLGLPRAGAAQAGAAAEPPGRDRTTRVTPPALPAGWVGISYSIDHHREIREGRAATSRTSYPVIVSVEPGSPAERAGLAAGDTILTFNNRDVRTHFPPHDLMRPGARLNVRVRRDGAVRTFVVNVAPRPTALTVGQGFWIEPVGADPRVAEEVRREMQRAQAEIRREATQAQAEIRRQAEADARAARAAAPTPRASPRPVAPSPPVPPTQMPLLPASSLIGIAGAEVTSLNADLADALGVRRGGVFVVRVHAGTPAAGAGLRGGDVIVAAGRSAIRDLAQLRQAIDAEQTRARAAGRAPALALQLVRKQQQQRVTLRW